MRAAKIFAEAVKKSGLLKLTQACRVENFGSLGLTGKGHGTDKALIMGLCGETPEQVETLTLDERVKKIKGQNSFKLLGEHEIHFEEKNDLIFHRTQRLPFHPNGMIFSVRDGQNQELLKKTYYSVGGGFVVDADHLPSATAVVLPYPFATCAELLTQAQRVKKTIAEITLENEKTWRSEAEIKSGLLKIWQAMQDCVARGCKQKGILPGGLKVKRRAPDLYESLTQNPELALKDPLSILDWVNLYALAVNEENAAGGRVVTAPTNGAAGVIPAVLHYFDRFSNRSSEEKIIEFLLTAGAIGILYKKNASISGAEVGCQGEVGVACSMAAAGLAAVLGGSNEQIENAAEIGMEHNLGLTCDPIGGLVQIPCIERNAMAATKAINAARIALHGDGTHKVSLDKVIKTMMQTGLDMQSQYKETSEGGLAINVVEC
jgi:L-serine dehydratase